MPKFGTYDTGTPDTDDLILYKDVSGGTTKAATVGDMTGAAFDGGTVPNPTTFEDDVTIEGTLTATGLGVWEAIASPETLFAFSQGTGGDPGVFRNAYQRITATDLGGGRVFVEAAFGMNPTDAGQAAQPIIINPHDWLAAAFGAATVRTDFQSSVEVFDNSVSIGQFYLDSDLYHLRLPTTGVELGTTYTTADVDFFSVRMSAILEAD